MSRLADRARLTVALLAAALAVVSLHPATARSQEEDRAATSLAITPVTVIDVRDGEALPDRAVVVEGDRITAVGSAESVQIPPDARVVDGSGKYLIPGLWDMHVHTGSDRNTRQVVFPLLVAHGVTGIRDMHADCFDCPQRSIGHVQARRRAVASGELIGPRVVASSVFAGSHRQAARRATEGSSPRAPATDADARAFVRLAKERGVDFIKVYDMLPREAYFALAEEAKRLGLPFAGHVPVEVRASEASNAGQASIEHLGMGNVLEECSSREDKLRRRVIAELYKAEMGYRQTAEGPALLPLLLEMIDTHDTEKCAALAERFVRNDTWIVPTLMVARLPGELGRGWREDPYARFLIPEERRYFEEAEEAYARDLGDDEARAPVSRWVREVTRVMHRAGVPMLAGSDAGETGIFWGISLHQELELLVSAGFSEAEALRAATLGPAQFLGATDSLGTVEEGKLTDLVLLEANPLEDITHTREIAGVILGGRYLDREALDQLLDEAERAANPPDATHDTDSYEERSPADEARGDTVHVAPPTGEAATDRANVQAAFDAVRPGGTIQFAPGTYRIGEFIRVATPGITLQGHPDGTTLRGCDPVMFDDIPVAISACNGLELTGERQTVRGLTFEHMWHALWAGCCLPEGLLPAGAEETGDSTRGGGHLIEGNTFRASVNGFRVIGDSPEPVVVQDNEFINVWHAGGVNGRTAHILDNRISVPDPARVPPNGFPGLALFITPYDTRLDRAFTCAGNVVGGNRVEGHPEGIAILAFRGGAICRDNAIRENTLRVDRVRFTGTPWGVAGIGDPADSTLVGVPITLSDLSARAAEMFGLPAEPGDEVLIRDNLIEGNRIVGAEGIGIELLRASDNRIVGNTVTDIVVREPFPGNTMYIAPPWEDANGSGIWISPGSDDNEIVGNTFEDVAAAAVVVEGDSNRVELASPEEEVRDLGEGNHIRIAGSTTKDAVLARTRSLAAAWERLDADAFLAHFDEGLTFWFEGSRFVRAEFDRVVRGTIDSLRESTFEVLNPEVVVLGPDAALVSFELRELMATESGDKTDLRAALSLVWQRRRGEWLAVQAHESLASQP